MSTDPGLVGMRLVSTDPGLMGIPDPGLVGIRFVVDWCLANHQVWRQFQELCLFFLALGLAF